MNDSRFDADFRRQLIVALCADPDFFRKAVDFLEPEMIIERPLQFAYSVIRRCYSREGRLPSPDVLQMAAVDDLKNEDIPFELKPSESELACFLDTISLASISLKNKSTEQTAYMNSKLREFIQKCYTAAIPDDATESQRVELYNQIYNQMQSYDTTASINSLTLDEILDKMSESIDIRNRIGTGLPCVDVPLNGGLAPGEIGLIVAGSGVGKSNSMLNFICENALRGNKSLYITMELSRMNVMSRLIALLTGIRASLVSKGTNPKALEAWTENERKRYHDLRDPNGRNRHLLESIEIIDHSDCDVTTDTLKQEVIKWKEANIKNGVDESKLGLVMVDWLRHVDPSTLSKVSRETNEASKMEAVVESLRQMGVATGTRVWTAQQASRNAINKEALTMQDGRDSSGTFNPVDIALGLAVKKEVGQKGSASKISSGSDKVKIDPDRDMIFSVIKDRNSGATGACIKFYQGPSLKFYESKKEYQRTELLNRSMT